jgi:uncharacterized protein
MRVNIDEIKEGGLARAWDLPRERVDDMVQGDRAGYRAQAPARLEAKLTRSGRRVLLSARGEAQVAAPCGRCLAPVTVRLPLDFDLAFVPEEERKAPAPSREDEGKGPVAASFEPTTADEEVYRGREIDLDPVVREQLILALPAYPVCRESCKGLCARCGANLNEREFGCDRTVPDPRWAGLEKFKKQ